MYNIYNCILPSLDGEAGFDFYEYGGTDMSYKSDMEQFNQQFNARKTNMRTALKISIVVLAALILVTAVVAIITAVNGGFDANPVSRRDEESGGDTKKPVITGPEGNIAVAYIGESIAYKSFVTATDNEGTPELMVDNSSVKPDTAGTYTVKYTATDASGNKATYTLTLVVRKRTVSDADLAKLKTDIAAKAQELGITSSLSKVEQVKKVYEFVNNWIPWGSDRSNIAVSHGSAFTRETWQADWQEEAILALKNKDGDCYSYYALSKAFFEHLGIENLGIRRSEKSEEQGTHFWNVVNIGTKEAPKWYYYDATELAGTFSDGTDYGCLMTEAKLNSYVTSKGGKQFYLFEKWEGFPTIATETVK